MRSPRKTMLVSIFAGLTVLYAIWNVGIGGVFIWGGANLMNEPGEGWGFLAQLLGVFVLLVGVPLLLFGLLTFVIGIGLFRRARWAQIFAFIVMAITLIWGGTSMYIADLTSEVVLYGCSHVAYGLLGIILLIVRSEEFSTGYREYERDYDSRGGSFATD